MGEWLRRVHTSQELTVEAALTGDRELAFEAMLADPSCGALRYDDVAAMTDDLLTATAPWLPQFAHTGSGSMAPRIVVIGGGSFQWVPKLFCDLVNTPSLAEAEIVLEDIDPAPLQDMVDFVRATSRRPGIAIKVSGTTDQRAALEGADYVVVTISTGGFASMRHDLEIPERYGIKQSVGDTVGPGGIMRALRNIPVLVGIARDMEDVCPDAWMLNITNPMTALCRAVTRETTIKTVGLCHEVTMAQFMLSLLLDADFRDIELDRRCQPPPDRHAHEGRRATTASRGCATCSTTPSARRRAGRACPPGLGHERSSFGGGIHASATCSKRNQVKLALFERFGVLPARGRPSPRRVLPRLPHRGVGVGPAVGCRAHLDRRP